MKSDPTPSDRAEDDRTWPGEPGTTPQKRVVLPPQFSPTSVPPTLATLATAPTEQPSVAVTPGSVVRPPPLSDEYSIICHLGGGGMGDVYLARDTSLDRLVAMKFIRDVDERPESIRRFLVEARATARIQHPNVLTVYRVGERDGRPYLVMEYIEGKGLDRIPKPAPWRRTLEIGLDLARGLAAAHRHGVLHRDIKPSNAILGKDGRVRLVDFGLAKLVKSASTSDRFRAATTTPPPSMASTPPPSLDVAGTMSLTQGGGMVGTPAYMAPEIWGGEPATERSDIYSLGALLFELCTGEPPHKGVPPVARRDLDAPSLAPFAARVDARLAAIVERCLHKDPSARYATGDELCKALEQLARSSERGGELDVHTLRSFARDADDDPNDGLDRPEVRPAVVRGNPYRGLRAFEREHRGVFFGRRAEVRTLLGRLRVESLVVVEGEYGVGKSSLCQAGVLPAVEEGALRENRAWSVVRFSPGPAPLLALGAALAPLLGVDARQAVRRLRAHPAAICQDLRARLGSLYGVVIFVDQLEELVTVGDPEGTRIVDEVLGHIAEGVVGVRLLMAVRSASLDMVQSLPWLGGQIGRALYLLKPLSPEGVREAITCPAQLAGARFESPALVETLVEETLLGTWGLPLLQFALSELWEVRDPQMGAITDATMERLGGGAIALARYADEVLRSMGAEQRTAAQRILTRLARPERCRDDDLVSSDPVARIALHELIRRRLVAVRGAEVGVTYELIHSALREDWGTLRDWLDAPAGVEVEWPETEGDDDVVRLRLKAAAMQWALLGGEGGRLWGEHELASLTGVDLRELSAEEQAFVAASRRGAAPGREIASRPGARRTRVTRTVARVLRTFASLADVLDPEPSSRPRTTARRRS